MLVQTRCPRCNNVWLSSDDRAEVMCLECNKSFRARDATPLSSLEEQRLMLQLSILYQRGANLVNEAPPKYRASPAPSAEPAALEPATGRAPPRRRVCKHVLMIDDDPLVLESLGALLDCREIAVATAFSRVAALPLIERQPPDFILMDYSIPGDMPPEKFIEKVRAKAPAARIVLVTGCDNAAGIAGRLGVEDFLEKPVDGEALMDLLCYDE